ncbi:hypothetical protein NC652_011807 [Populus alba x Populus x berolinensis]|nr:hypothetical protein NC652_011807 [Populus alba x Populus x berolinensis]
MRAGHQGSRDCVVIDGSPTSASVDTGPGPSCQNIQTRFWVQNILLLKQFLLLVSCSQRIMNSLGNNLKDSLLCLRKCLKLLCCFFTDY